MREDTELDSDALRELTVVFKDIFGNDLLGRAAFVRGLVRQLSRGSSGVELCVLEQHRCGIHACHPLGLGL